MKVKATVMGASGYIGGEVVRLLLGHPNVDLVGVTAQGNAGKRLDEVQPNLRGYSDLVFTREPVASDVTFLALPHGEAMRVVPELGGKVIDLSADFRLSSSEAFSKYYSTEHTAWELQKDFVFGIPELHRGRIREAEKVAVGGCFATAAILSLRPMKDLVEGQAVVDGKTGSSGSGNKPGSKTHHPLRSGSFFAYGPFHHRHTPEIEEQSGLSVLFQPHSAPMVRGVFTSSYLSLKKPGSTGELFSHFQEFYEDSPFVRLSTTPPNVRNVACSNFADIGVAVDGKRAIIWAAIDNLVKGGAGQAVQCLNLMYGWEETSGLLQAPAMP